MVSLCNPGWFRTHNFPATASMGGDYRITPLNQTSIFLQSFCTVGKGKEAEVYHCKDLKT